MNQKFNADKQNKIAEKFHSLHHANETLILPNAWDCISAKIFEENKFPAIATTSTGVAWCYGYKDGEHIPPHLVIETINRITQTVSVPVTADIEGGYYRNNIEKFSQFIHNIIEAGAIGINIEDGHAHTEILNDVNHHITLIKLAKEIGKEKGVNLFVNARTDAMLLNTNLKNKIEACIERTKIFEEAGADGAFIPFVKDIETVAQIKQNINLPLNILFADTLNIEDLKKLKINRISIGGRAMLATMNLLKEISNEIKNSNNWFSLFTKEPTYAEVNAWFK